MIYLQRQQYYRYANQVKTFLFDECLVLQEQKMFSPQLSLTYLNSQLMYTVPKIHP